jgi:hypothetical protein
VSELCSSTLDFLFRPKNHTCSSPPLPSTVPLKRSQAVCFFRSAHHYTVHSIINKTKPKNPRIDRAPRAPCPLLPTLNTLNSPTSALGAAPTHSSLHPSTRARSRWWFRCAPSRPPADPARLAAPAPSQGPPSPPPFFIRPPLPALQCHQLTHGSHASKHTVSQWLTTESQWPRVVILAGTQYVTVVVLQNGISIRV